MKHNKTKEFDPIRAGRRMELKNNALGCLAALGYLVLRFAVIAAFAVGIIRIISKLQPWS